MSQRLAHIFVVEGRVAPEDEFKFRVEQEKLQACFLKRLWRFDG
jgi:hypothetical protein